MAKLTGRGQKLGSLVTEKGQNSGSRSIFVQADHTRMMSGGKVTL